MNFSVEKPCHEKWDSMQVRSDGRYCSSCSRVVIDFSEKSNEEIISFLSLNKDKKTCGKFSSEQLGINKRIQKNKFKIFLAAIYLVFGGFLFSNKLNAQMDTSKAVIHYDYLGYVNLDENQTSILTTSSDSLRNEHFERTRGQLIELPQTENDSFRVDSLVKKYPQGVTEIIKLEKSDSLVTRIVIVKNQGWIYQKTIYTWGTFYFKDGRQVSQAQFDKETSPAYVKKLIGE